MILKSFITSEIKKENSDTCTMIYLIWHPLDNFLIENNCKSITKCYVYLYHLQIYFGLYYVRIINTLTKIFRKEVKSSLTIISPNIFSSMLG